MKTVVDHATGKPLAGSVSDRLLEEIARRAPGKCLAYLDGGAWYWCADHVAVDMRAAGYDVRPVSARTLP